MSDLPAAPPFDPSKPFTLNPKAPPPFDPSKPFTTGIKIGRPTPAEESGGVGTSVWQGLLHGLGNVGVGAARLGAAAVGPPGSADEIGQGAAARQRTFERTPEARAHPTATAIGEVAGEMGATLPLGATRAGASVWERLLSGTGAGSAGGAIGAATTAPGGNRFAPAIARGAEAGALTGGAMTGAGAMLRPSAMNAPRAAPSALVDVPPHAPGAWRDAARTLVSGGVRLSPGEARNVGYRERAFQEWPLLRKLVLGQVGNSVDDFNRAVVSQALSPLGTIVPRSVPAGHKLMDFGADQFNKAYDQVLPHLTLARQPIVGVLQSHPEIAKIVGRMSTDDAKSFVSRIQSDVLGRFDQTGVMDGQTWKLAEGSLSKQADRISGTRPELSDALKQTLSVLRDELATQNPTYAPQLQKINHAFSMWARVRAAAERDAAGQGRFTPRALLQTLKNESPSNTAFGRGREPMQAFAEAGEEVIQPSISARSPIETKSPLRMIGEAVGGAGLAIPYGLAAGASRVPGLDRGFGAAAPGAGVEAGKDRVLRPSIGGM
jgi:hypothetical protein